MVYSIYQLKDGHNNLFMNYKWAMSHGGINLRDYKKVYTGGVTPRDSVNRTLEEIYTILNTKYPEDYRGHSLSVSDLVVLEDVGTFFCDSIGFKQII